MQARLTAAARATQNRAADIGEWPYYFNYD